MDPDLRREIWDWFFQVFKLGKNISAYDYGIAKSITTELLKGTIDEFIRLNTRIHN